MFNYLNNLHWPLYKYWLVGFGLFLLGVFVHQFFYVPAIIVWVSSTTLAIKIRSK